MSMSPLRQPGRLELWGGLECTIARIGEEYRDQIGETGHHQRPADLDLIAELGIRTLRYPVLWESISPDAGPLRGWDWHDERLGRLQKLGITPIVGLVHHGSGPRDVDLLHPEFAPRLADHARLVAERYPWVTHYTPVNEPLTTARFSALYGHWYPHRQSYPDFLRALVNQCQAVCLSMRAIRQVNPGAQLVQTEDIGRIFSTPALVDQAEHENGRRWLSLDLLFGKIGPDHPWWQILLDDNGISEGELEQFQCEPPPSLVGVNHYLTSDRYLDDNAAAYPQHLEGNNGRSVYADAEAVRIPSLDGCTGPAARLREVAARYAAPIAITEVHHGCTRDEQLRWLKEVWDAAELVRAEGADVRAVTVWSLFGAFDWNSLLRARQGIYEPGIFDIRGPSPRPTALAKAAASLATTATFDHPVLDAPGWWRRKERLYGAEGPVGTSSRGRTIAIVGAQSAFVEECAWIAARRGLSVDVWSPGRLLRDGLRSRSIWAVLDATGVEGAAPDAEMLSPGLTVATRRNLPYVFLSGPAIFGAVVGADHREADRTRPLSRVGYRGEAAERLVARTHAGALIVRTGTLFGPGSQEQPDLARIKGDLQRLGNGLPSGCFSYVPDLLHVVLDLLIDREQGVRHLVSVAGGARYPAAAMASGMVSLATERGVLMPPLQSALTRYTPPTPLEGVRAPWSFEPA
ncbi:MAG: dTDP-4-dehydrorhamnose reductase [Enterovirga sp.]|nr:dTDP-4-dehydrorhamnose reductase [Enterovirga sp.]